MGSATTTVSEYLVGTLVVDIFDAKTKALLFRGIAQRRDLGQAGQEHQEDRQGGHQDVQELPARVEEEVAARAFRSDVRPIALPGRGLRPRPAGRHGMGGDDGRRGAEERRPPDGGDPAARARPAEVQDRRHRDGGDRVGQRPERDRGGAVRRGRPEREPLPGLAGPGAGRGPGAHRLDRARSTRWSCPASCACGGCTRASGGGSTARWTSGPATRARASSSRPTSRAPSASSGRASRSRWTGPPRSPRSPASTTPGAASLSLGYERRFPDRWVALVKGQVEQNRELGFDLRSSAAVGGGRYLVQEQKNRLARRGRVSA